MVVAAIVVLLAAYVVVVIIRAHQDRMLPRTAQSWPIGRSRLDMSVPTAGVPDRVADSVWLWFPSATDPEQPAASYAPGLWNAMHFPGPLGQAETNFDDLRVRSRENVAPASGRFPLIILEPGMGFSAPQYQTLAEDLAAAGFVVAGVTPTGSANVTVVGGHLAGSTDRGDPPDLGSHHGRPEAEADRLVLAWSTAARAVAGKLRHTKIIADHLQRGTVYVGHSFGGAAALQACLDDQGCRGAVDLDGTQFGAVVGKGLDKPLMLISSSDSCITGSCPTGATVNPDDRRIARTLLQHSRGPAWCRSVAGVRHFNFSDYGAYYIALPLRKLLALGSVDGAQALRTIDSAVIAFATYATTGQTRPALSTIPSCP